MIHLLVFLERLGDEVFGLWIVFQGGIEVFLFKVAMNGQILFELPKQLITLGCFLGLLELLE